MVQISIFMLFSTLTIVLYKKYNSLKCPPVLHSLIYSLCFLIFIITKHIIGLEYNLKPLTYYFFIGAIIFFLTFEFGKFVFNKTSSPPKYIHFKLPINSITYIIFIYIQILMMIISMIYLYNTISSSYTYGSIVQHIINTLDNLRGEMPYINKVFRTICTTGSAVALAQLLKNSVNQKLKKYFYIQILIGIYYCLVSSAKIIIFKFTIPLFFVYFLTYQNKKSVRKILLIFSCITLVLFFGILFIRSFGNVDLKYAIQYFMIYTCSGFMSFVEWCTQGFEPERRGYIFRIIYAILNKIGFNIDVPNILRHHMVLPNTDFVIGNVYSFYSPFVKDFGYWHGLFAQGLLGIFFGFIDTKYKKHKDIFWTTIYALMYYPLIMHFFDDHFILITSYHIQCIVTAFILCRTNLFFDNKNLS